MATVDLGAVLDHFVVSVPEVTDAVAMSPDGRVLATTSGMPERRRNELAAIGASMMGLLGGAAQLLRAGRVVSNIVHMDGGFMFCMRLAPDVSVLVVASAECDVAQVGRELPHLTGWLSPDEPFPDLPAQRSAEPAQRHSHLVVEREPEPCEGATTCV